MSVIEEIEEKDFFMSVSTELQALREEIAELRARYQSPSISQAKEAPRARDPTRDNFGRIIITIDRKQQRINLLETTLRRRIDVLKNNSVRKWADKTEVLTLYYIRGLSVADIAVMKYGDGNKKRDVYRLIDQGFSDMAKCR